MEINPVKEAVIVPEPLVSKIEIGIDLYRRQQAGARFQRDELSEGEWCCLLGAIEGVNRARNEKAEAERQRQEQQLRQRQMTGQ